MLELNFSIEGILGGVVVGGFQSWPPFVFEVANPEKIHMEKIKVVSRTNSQGKRGGGS